MEHILRVRREELPRPDFNFKKKCKLSGHQGEFAYCITFRLSDEVDHREPPQFISAASRKQCGSEIETRRNSDKIRVLFDYFEYFTTELLKTRWSKALNQTQLTETQELRNWETLGSACEISRMAPILTFLRKCSKILTSTNAC